MIFTCFLLKFSFNVTLVPWLSTYDQVALYVWSGFMSVSKPKIRRYRTLYTNLKKRYRNCRLIGKSEYLQDNRHIKVWTEGPGRTALCQLEYLGEFAVDPAGRIVQQGETRHNSAGGRAQSAVNCHWTQAMATNCVEWHCKKPLIPNLLRALEGSVGNSDPYVFGSPRSGSFTLLINVLSGLK